MRHHGMSLGFSGALIKHKDTKAKRFFARHATRAGREVVRGWGACGGLKALRYIQMVQARGGLLLWELGYRERRLEIGVGDVAVDLGCSHIELGVCAPWGAPGEGG